MSGANAMTSAESIGGTFEVDPELTLPIRPRLIPELVVIPFADAGLLFAGASATQVLLGRSARTRIPQILALMDGTRTVEQLASAMPALTVRDIRNVEALLHSRGLLEDGTSAPAPALFEDVDALLGRWIDITRQNANRTDAWARLRDQQVAIVGGTASAPLLEEQLRRSGVGAVRSCDDIRGDVAGTSLVIGLAEGDADDPTACHLDAVNRGIRSLHVRVSAEAVEVGPLFVPGDSACPSCFRALTGPPPRGEVTDANTRQFWVSMASLHVFQLLSAICDSRLFNTMKRYQPSPDGVTTSLQAVARMPGCKYCRIDGSSLARTSPEALAWLLHNSVALAPREMLSVRSHQNHYNASNIALTVKAEDPYYGAETIPVAPAPLDVPLPWTAVAQPDASTVTVEQLATILTYAAGHQSVAPGSTRRIAPTGGGLGSPHLFVIANRVAGLRRGVYHFDGRQGLLERLRDEPDGALEAALGTRKLAACTIVGTADLEKIQNKYGGFAYRLVHLDAGIALGYAYLVAAALRVSIEEHADFHDRALAALLGIPTLDSRYVPTFALSLNDRGEESTRALLPSGPELTAHVIRSATLPKPTAVVCERDRSSALGVAGDAGSFEQVLRSRRSSRLFSPQAPSPEALRRLMATAAALCRTRLGTGGPPVDVEPWLALRVQSGELLPGVYRMDSTAPTRLRMYQSGCSAEQLFHSVLQKTLAAAPAVIFLCGDFSTAFSRRGSRGYRELLIQGGVAASQILLTATAEGLSSCPSGGLMETGFRALTGTDGFAVAPMLAICVGHAAE